MTIDYYEVTDLVPRAEIHELTTDALCAWLDRNGWVLRAILGPQDNPRNARYYTRGDRGLWVNEEDTHLGLCMAQSIGIIVASHQYRAHRVIAEIRDIVELQKDAAQKAAQAEAREQLRTDLARRFAGWTVTTIPEDHARLKGGYWLFRRAPDCQTCKERAPDRAVHTVCIWPSPVSKKGRWLGSPAHETDPDRLFDSMIEAAEYATNQTAGD